MQGKLSKGQQRQRARMYNDKLRKSCAITVDTPKTSALIFEKLYLPSDLLQEAPIDLVTYRKGAGYSTFGARSDGGPMPEQRQVSVVFRERPGKPAAILVGPSRESLLYSLNRDPQPTCTTIADTGHRPVLCYSRYDKENEVLGGGEHEFAVSCIRNLGVVDEEHLTWEQVLDFRKDEESRASVGRFLFWLDSAMRGKSKAEIEDIIGDLYEKNQSALRKFGIYTAEVCDSFISLGERRLKELATSLSRIGVARAFDAVLAVLGAGFVIAGTTMVGVRKAKARIKNEHDATAFLHSLANLAPPQLPRLPGDGPVSFGGDEEWLFR